MFGIGLPEMLVILAVALIVVGPDKLPELARSLARGVIELKKAAETVKEDLMSANPLPDIKNDLKAELPNLADFTPDLSDLHGAAKRLQEEILDIRAEEMPALIPALLEKTTETDAAAANEDAIAVTGNCQPSEPDIITDAVAADSLASAAVDTLANTEANASKDVRADDQS